MNLELMALCYLRFEKHCPVALFERSPRAFHGRPDVLGITRDRYLLEIEVKRSVADFKANEHKRHVQARMLQQEFACSMWPKRFWFLVPHELVASVQPLLPEYAGLLRGPGPDDVQQLFSVVSAPTNKASKRLEIREMVRLTNCMANHILSAEKRIETLARRLAEAKTVGI